MGFINEDSERRLIDLGIEVAKLINGLLGVLEPEAPRNQLIR